MTERLFPADELLPIVYAELRALARRYLRGEQPGHILDPTALVHEAYLRVSRLNRIVWRGKTHFFAVAAVEMRRILVEHARRSAADKRGGGATRIPLRDDLAAMEPPPIDVLRLDQALERLERRSERQCRVAEMRLFSGMQYGEIAVALEVSERTVRGDWRLSRAWLARELRGNRGTDVRQG